MDNAKIFTYIQQSPYNCTWCNSELFAKHTSTKESESLINCKIQLVCQVCEAAYPASQLHSLNDSILALEQAEANYRETLLCTAESRRLIADLLDAYYNKTLDSEMVNHLRDRAEKILKDFDPSVRQSKQLNN